MSGLMFAFPKPYADFVARLRVPGGFLLMAAFAYFSRPSVSAIEIGLPVSIAGLALRAWAAGCLAKNQQLAKSGPYAYTRNPLYLGTLLVAAGLAIAARNPGLGVLFAAVFLLIYLPVIQLEEQHLRKLFSGYGAYAARVPALWPRFSALPRETPHPFRFGMYMRNREYQASVAFLAAMLFLFWKART
jgi:protein-S-isoprenylcysteine O-methyltransferase Ste14